MDPGPVLDVFDALTLRASRKICLLLLSSPLLFKDLVSQVGHRSVVSRTLRRLEKLGLVEKEVLQEPYRPVQYSLTDLGTRFAKIVSDLEALERARPG